MAIPAVTLLICGIGCLLGSLAVPGTRWPNRDAGDTKLFAIAVANLGLLQTALGVALLSEGEVRAGAFVVVGTCFVANVVVLAAAVSRVSRRRVSGQ